MSAAENQAVFLSYASQDAAAVARIAEALRAAGVEVWFDQNELVGGDAWDAKIRKQIAECALFVPVISANTQSRREGYFRIEWRLAAQRTHAMADGTPFLLPVVVDDTRDSEALVPVEFKGVQWTRLRPAGYGGQARPEGEGPAVGKFCERVRNLLGGAPGEAGPVGDRAAGQRPVLQENQTSGRRLGPAALAALVLGLLAIVGYFMLRPAPKAAAPASTPAAAPPSEARRLVAQARALIDDDPMRVRENFHTADELCGRATSLSPDDAEAWATWARATCVLISDYSEKGDKQIAAARTRAERAIRLAPDSIESGLAMANFDAVAGAGEQAAMQRLLALLPRAPNDRRIPRMLATIAGDMIGTVDDARRWAEQADAMPGGDSQALEQLAWAYWGHNRLPEMEVVLDRIFARQPTSVAYHLRLMVLWASGDLDGVLAWLEKTPPAVLAEDRVVSIAVDTYQMKGRPEQALALLARIPREFLEEGRYLAPKSYLVGEVLRAMGKPRAAEVEFRSALKSLDDRIAANPHDGQLFSWKGRVLVKLGDRAEAAKQFETGRELGANSTVRVSAADEVLLGRYDAALAEIDRRLQREQTRWPSFLTQLKYGPEYEPLRGDPRFQALLARGQAWLDEMRPASAVKAGTAEKSVAVLAFDNRSDDKDAEYFSDGVSEELINALGRVPGLTVKGRTSAFFFKGKQVKSEEIGQQLGVAYLVRGSVRKAGGKVRITAQLSRAATDEIVWSSEPLERDLKDVFAVQDEIAGLIAKNLSLKLGAARRAPQAINPEAYRLYLEGRHFWSLRTFGGFDRAEAALRQAMVLEPESALLRAGLAELHATRGWYRAQNAQDPGDSYALAAAEADRAVALDPENAQAISARATIAIARRQFGEAAQFLQQALALAPNDAGALDRLGDLMVRTGQLDGAVENYRRAMQLDPLSVYLVRDFVRESTYARRFRDVIEAVDRFEAGSPRDWRTIVWRAQALVHFGKTDQAASELRGVLPRITPDDFSSSGASIAELVFSLRVSKCEAESEALARQLLERHRPGTYLHAMVLAARGRMEEALPLLVAFPVGAEDRLYWSAIFDPLREDPRFQRKIEEFGVAAEYKVARATLARMLREPAVKN